MGRNKLNGTAKQRAQGHRGKEGLLSSHNGGMIGGTSKLAKENFNLYRNSDRAKEVCL